MQVQLSEENERLVDEYRKAVQSKLPTYKASATAIVNGAVVCNLHSELTKLKGKKSK
jgi:hypothetical protein